MPQNEPQKLHPPKFNEVKFGGAKRKNQAILDFLEDIKKQLNDTNPRNFGLYMKLYKGYGKDKLQRAADIAVKRFTLSNFAQQNLRGQEFRYFLGVLKKDPSTTLRTGEIKEKSATINKEVLNLYKKMKAGLKKKMTPKIQKRAGVYSKILHKVAKEERKSNR